MSTRQAVLITHSYPENSAAGVSAAVAAAKAAGFELVAAEAEYDKHGSAADGLVRVGKLPEKPELCLVLGGDGSILYALREFAHRDVPVFGINFGTVGFLAAAERDQLDSGLTAAFGGEYEVLDLPGLRVELDGQAKHAFNDFAFARRPHGRVAELSYSLSGQEVGHVRSDGLVAATPVGSTGYNLANGGPILAWGVEGFVVSFISPHTLTARALVVAPDDVLTVTNAAGRDPVDVSQDGDLAGQLGPGQSIEVRFEDSVGRLAQLRGSSFYGRIREKFGLLARPAPRH